MTTKFVNSCSIFDKKTKIGVHEEDLNSSLATKLFLIFLKMSIT